MIARLWGAGIAKIINLKIKVTGNPLIAGGLIVSNHLSYLDIIAHASLFPLRFTPKADIASWPFLGWFIYVSRPIWVKRESKQASHNTLKEFRETLENGINLIVYPEGTSSSGEGILKFKSTPFEAAVSGNARIYPVLIKYFQKSEERTLCWFGGMTLVPHLWHILSLPEIIAEVKILEPILPGKRNRKELAKFVHDTMSEEFKTFKNKLP